MISVEDLTLLTLAILFGVYGLFCSALCGMSIARLFPRLLHPAKHHIFEKPSYEAGNAFLLAGLGGFTLLFANASELIGPEIDYLIILGLVAVLIRASLLFWMVRQTKQTLVTTPIKILFATASFAVPLCMAAAGVYLLYGKEFWQSSDAWLLMVAAAAGAFSVGLCVVNAKKNPQRLAAALWLLVLGCLWPLSLEMTGSHLLGYWLGLWLSFAIVAISVVAVTDGLARRNYLRLAIPALALISVPLLAAANSPYLVYGQITTQQAFSGDAWRDAVVLLCALAWIGAAYGSWVLFKLAEPKKISTLKAIAA